MKAKKADFAALKADQQSLELIDPSKGSLSCEALGVNSS